MRNVIDMGFDTFEGNDALRRSLAWSLADGLKNVGDSPLLCDCGLGNKIYSGFEILSQSLALSERLRGRGAANGRLGIAIPPSFPGAVANYAAVFAGLRPVNLNFTLGEKAAASCFKTGGIQTVLTARIFREKITKANPHFPWPGDTKDFFEIASEIPDGRIGRIDSLARTDFAALAESFGIEKYADNAAEATLVFTSGSEGNPKAAVLTERNLIANCLQTKLCGLFEDGDVFMANLPIFHSFGQLFEVWYMALHGQYTVTLSNPLDIKNNIRAIRENRVSIMIGSPTFLRPYLKYASPEDMKSMRKAVSGAEKTPNGFAELWDSRFGESYREGYGLTEASPVVGVNLPERDFGWYSTGTRKGSIGKIFPGMQARILDVDTLEELPLGEQGLLSLRGANIFAGYLDNPEATSRTLTGEWLVTGDLARLDKDGFLYVDGRISRFSKIGGEMVPHATVESALIKHLGFGDSEIPMLAVSSRLDESKGEALVLLSAADISLPEVKKAAREAGLSNLWHPKHIVRVDKIPVLPTGKLNLREIAAIAAKPL
ncbi:MAG: AMP-dependent synthetase [Verrucomicrobia bacterium]|nr:MAG: AMP-dependent synthetase [Verrucomicrobiota bacterium]